MLSPNDRNQFPYPAYIFGANRFIGDAYELASRIKDDTFWEGLDQTAIENMRQIALKALEVSGLIVKEIDARNS